MDHLELTLNKLCNISGGYLVNTKARAYTIDSEVLCGLPCGNKAAFLAKPKNQQCDADLPICEACFDRFSAHSGVEPSYMEKIAD